MKLVRCIFDGTERVGALQGEEIALSRGTIFEPFSPAGATVKLGEVTLLPPVSPSKVLCIGLNYRDHAAEVGAPLPTVPVVFMKASTAVIPHGAAIEQPSMVQHLDYECELAAVIGRTAKNVPESEALDYLLGYTCANDVTARDYQRPDNQWEVAKGFDTFCPLGPWIATDVDPVAGLDISTRVNGELKQHSNTKNLIFTVPYLISYLSHIFTLLPGDVIITGTPSGISRLTPGDEVVVEIEGIGALKNTVKAV